MEDAWCRWESRICNVKRFSIFLHKVLEHSIMHLFIHLPALAHVRIFWTESEARTKPGETRVWCILPGKYIAVRSTASKLQQVRRRRLFGKQILATATHKFALACKQTLDMAKCAQRERANQQMNERTNERRQRNNMSSEQQQVLVAVVQIAAVDGE